MATTREDPGDLLENQDIDTYESDDDDAEDTDDKSRMTLIEHLQELRKRLFIVVLAILVGSIVAFIFRDLVVDFLAYPFPKQVNALTQSGRPLIVTGLTEGFAVFLKLSIAVGFVLALPVILYQLWAFISPALIEKEKKYAVPFIIMGIVLFAAGLSLGYVILRYPVEWLVTFASDTFTELISANSYFGFVAIFLLTFGCIFEIPLVLAFLAQIGVVTADTLKQKRSYAHFGLWIFATFMMPGGDIWSPILLGLCMSGLYELTILFIQFLKR